MCFIGKIVFHENETGGNFDNFPGLEEKGRGGGRGSFSKLGSCYVFKKQYVACNAKQTKNLIKY